MRHIGRAARRAPWCFALLVVGAIAILAAVLSWSGPGARSAAETRTSEHELESRKPNGSVSPFRGVSLPGRWAPSKTSAVVRSGGIHGTLRASKVNPRYFADPSGRSVYLTGSHTWYAFQDEARSDAIDYKEWLSFLTRADHNFNFLRLWNAEVWINGPSIPSPYRRTGPGLAPDGRPKYDLDSFNQAYFDRLRARVILAGQNGIYVAFCLFNGWAVRDNGEGNPWPHHFFNRANNINGVDGDTNDNGQGEEVPTLRTDSRVTRYQMAFVRKVVDTLNDLDNVLWEIANEPQRESVSWQYAMISFLRAYEGTKEKAHPIGMSAPGFGTSNDAVFNSPADWVAPAAYRYGDANDPWATDMPPAHGNKVVVLDTDHIGYKFFMGDGQFQRTFAWKAFARGMNPILMEDFRSDFARVRATMGQTRRFAERMNLKYAVPRGDLTSTRFALANPGHEYLILQPTTGGFSVDLSHTSRSFDVEWFAPATGESQIAGPLRGGATVAITPPFAGPAVVYLTGR